MTENIRTTNHIKNAAHALTARHIVRKAFRGSNILSAMPSTLQAPQLSAKEAGAQISAAILAFPHTLNIDRPEFNSMRDSIPVSSDGRPVAIPKASKPVSDKEQVNVARALFALEGNVDAAIEIDSYRWLMVKHLDEADSKEPYLVGLASDPYTNQRRALGALSLSPTNLEFMTVIGSIAQNTPRPPVVQNIQGILALDRFEQLAAA